MARDGSSLAQPAGPGQPGSGAATTSSWRERLLGWHRGRCARAEVAQALYAELVAQARRPVFYAAWGVPDSRDGRLELVGLHVILLIRRLRREGREGQELAQELLDAMFADLDRHLREWGVGDQSIGRHAKKLAQSFFGRADALDRLLAGADAAALDETLRRNVYTEVAAPDPASVRRLGRYLGAQDRWLAARDGAAMLRGTAGFARPEDTG